MVNHLRKSFINITGLYAMTFFEKDNRKFIPAIKSDR